MEPKNENELLNYKNEEENKETRNRISPPIESSPQWFDRSSSKHSHDISSLISSISNSVDNGAVHSMANSTSTPPISSSSNPTVNNSLNTSTVSTPLPPLVVGASHISLMKLPGTSSLSASGGSTMLSTAITTMQPCIPIPSQEPHLSSSNIQTHYSSQHHPVSTSLSSPSAVPISPSNVADDQIKINMLNRPFNNPIDSTVVPSSHFGAKLENVTIAPSDASLIDMDQLKVSPTADNPSDSFHPTENIINDSNESIPLSPPTENARLIVGPSDITTASQSLFDDLNEPVSKKINYGTNVSSSQPEVSVQSSPFRYPHPVVGSVTNPTFPIQSQSSQNTFKTGYSFDSRLLAHENPITEHPEQPDRILIIYESLVQSGLSQRLVHIPARLATNTELLLVHDEDYINWMASTAFKEPTEYEMQSVYYNQSTAECARLACGATLQLAENIWKGSIRNGFAIVRPPGHHAECRHAMGFCFYNNVAVAARYLQSVCNVKKILIVDWDIHHGNGTQHTFISDPNVLYISIHRYEHGSFFPGEKDADYTYVGKNEGLGKNVNIPWSDVEMGDSEYMAAFHQIVLPIAYEFCPDFVLISAGFDAAEGDPIGDYHVTPECYGHMTHLLSGLAGGKVLLCLEGGYSLDALPNCAQTCLRALLGDPLVPLPCLVPNITAIHILDRVVSVHTRYWKCFGSGRGESTNKGSSLLSHKLRLGLKSMFRMFWQYLMTETYRLIKIPLPDPSACEIDGDIYASPSILFAKQTLFVLFHDMGAFQRSYALPSDKTLTNADVITYPYLKYIDMAFESSYTLIDVICFSSSTKRIIDRDGMETTKDGTKHNIAYYLWDNFLSHSISKQVIMVGIGTGANLVSDLLTSREVKDTLQFVVLFPNDESLKPVPITKAPWFYEHSCVFIPSPEPKHSVIPFSRSFGYCISSGFNESSSATNPVLDNAEYVFRKIKEKLALQPVGPMYSYSSRSLPNGNSNNTESNTFNHS